ncbi:hypothetical protein [Burkholderia seminalis]|uniref:hypothetical protein n=1 Tax=Burkholderia seminalis TaxID=488731 RepID=UPI00264D24DD|nr:hypothetical protein [Burkholderia seminalis]MDN7849291.1 hypothetical protein [Burkholderia seminalis]
MVLQVAADGRQRMHELGEADGFPPLPAADLELHRSPGICDPLTDDLVSLIESMVDERRRASLEAFA